MHRRFKLIFRTQRGAAVVEWALLIALIAVVCIVALTTIGPSPESSSDRSTAVPTSESPPTSVNNLDTTGNPADTATNNSSTAGQESPRLECPEVYQSRALASLKKAELLYKYSNQEGRVDHLLNQAKTYLTFAQYADKSGRKDC